MSEEMNLYKRCKNIFKFHGVDMGGGESAPEVENAIETHGLGWTDTEEKAGFDIQWDGNTEGLETISVVMGSFYKVSDVLDIMNPIDNLIGANLIASNGESFTVIAEDIETQDNKVFGLCESSILIALEDGHLGEYDVPKGVWFMDAPGFFYASRFYKESTTEEVVHQIDQKYIPGIPEAPVDGKQYARKDGNWSEVVGGSGGGALMVTLTPDESYTSGVADKRISAIYNAISSGTNVVLKIPVAGTAMYYPLAMAFPAEVGFGPYVTTEEGSACQIRATYNGTLGEDEWEMSL